MSNTKITNNKKITHHISYRGHAEPGENNTGVALNWDYVTCEECKRLKDSEENSNEN